MNFQLSITVAVLHLMHCLPDFSVQVKNHVVKPRMICFVAHPAFCDASSVECVLESISHRANARIITLWSNRWNRHYDQESRFAVSAM